MTSNVSVQNVPMGSSMSWQFWIEDSIIPLYTITSSTNAQPCPEPDTKPDLTYDIISGMETCYKGYGLYSRVSYFCTYGPNLQPRKTLQCRSGGRWMETDKTAWPNCSTYVPPTTTTCEDCNSGTLLTFHLKLLAATFLIASYYTVK
uniref:Sushi domain-containing protein n=1 Tax=Coptotermes formosanus TaxID=36987 RepID=R4UKL4_COPFO|nr:hypothetical protein [Coptotermes formosanus]